MKELLTSGPLQWLAGQRTHHGRDAGSIPAPTATIRRRTPRDVAACARLLGLVSTSTHPPAWGTDSPRAYLTADELLEAWVADHEGEILGHVALSRPTGDAASLMRWREITGHEPDRLGEVTRLFVRPRARGQGIGAALLATAV